MSQPEPTQEESPNAGMINIGDDEAPEWVPAAELDTEEPDPSTLPRPLSHYLVDHSATIGLPWEAIEALRPPYVILEFLREGEVMLLGAESKSRKSWLAQDAGIAVALGSVWLPLADGTGGFLTKKATVHVIDLELDRSEMQFRFAKTRGNRFPDDHALQVEVTAAFRSYCFDGMNVKDIVVRLDEIKETVLQGDLVIVDCFYRLVPDGNETVDVAAMLETLKRFASEKRCAIILVDHFRKAGDDRARNRFAGTYVKQASANTLVAIECKDDILTMSIDARTFHGVPTVHARFELDSYSFVQVTADEIEAVKLDAKQVEQIGHLVLVWKSRSLDSRAITRDAMEKWGITKQVANRRFSKLVEAGLLEFHDNGKGKQAEWSLTDEGRGHVIRTLSLSTKGSTSSK